MVKRIGVLKLDMNNTSLKLIRIQTLLNMLHILENNHIISFNTNNDRHFKHTEQYFYNI